MVSEQSCLGETYKGSHMEQIEQSMHSEEQSPMKLRLAFLYWLGFLVLWLSLLVFSAYWKPLGSIAILVYLGAGFYLNKKVLPQLICWHPVYNTLTNVTSEKLKLFLFWPITYLILLFKLGVDKVL